MLKQNYIFGNVYYQFTFFDSDFKFPDLLPLVYVGKNIESSEDDLWFFQEIDFYLSSGAFLGVENYSNDQITDFMNNSQKLHVFSESLLINIYSLDEIIHKLKMWRDEPDGKKWRK